MHTLVIVNPGHFHAGLILRRRHAEISRDVYIFSEAAVTIVIILLPPVKKALLQMKMD